MKLAESKIAKQLSGYILIQQDLDFARQAFKQASTINPKQRPLDLDQTLKSAKIRFDILDPLLRRGGAYPIHEMKQPNPESVRKCALFEAGLIAYARCFNRGLRTGLSKDVFKNELAPAMKVHEFMLNVRNKHVGHSYLEREHSVIAFENVDDRNYGKRPSTILSIISGRIRYPENIVLERLADHCDLVDVEVVQPKVDKATHALREELLKLTKKQTEQLTDLADAPTNFVPLTIDD